MKKDILPHITTKKLGLAALTGAILLTILVSSGMAAPNQERLHRRSPDTYSTPAPEVIPPILPVPKQIPQQEAFNSWQEHQQIVYSDRAYLSTTLALEEFTARMAHTVLDTKNSTMPRIEEWATKILRTSDRRIDIIRTLLKDLGGTDEKVYRQAESRLNTQYPVGQDYTPAARFLIFLFTYCKASMENAIPALMESPSADVMEMARRILGAQSTLAAEIRAWLQSHHFRSNT
ncbi:MAG: hypothetical protein IJY48_02985 [Mailhella sp.]|nr:hypothetical protein [Mailhella sp.]